MSEQSSGVDDSEWGWWRAIVTDVLADFVHEAAPSGSHSGLPRPAVLDTVALPSDSPPFLVAMTLPEGLLPSAPAVVLAHRVRTHLAELDRPDLEACDGATLVGDLQLIEQIESYLHAVKAQRLALLTRPGVAGDPSALVERRLSENTMLASLTPEQVQVVREGETVLAAEQLAVAQVGAAMVVAPGTAARRVHEAIDLAENLPETLIALGDGQLDHQRARILADRSSVLSAALRHELERRLLAKASTCTPRQWRNLVDAEIIALDPEAAEQRRRDAVERRKLRLEKLDDGIGRLLVELPAHQAQLAWDLFDAVAEALRGLDDRTVDQRRADAFVTIVEMLASGQTVSVADILGHPDITRHDTCYRPEHPADLTDEGCGCPADQAATMHQASTAAATTETGAAAPDGGSAAPGGRPPKGPRTAPDRERCDGSAGEPGPGHQEESSGEPELRQQDEHSGASDPQVEVRFAEMSGLCPEGEPRTDAGQRPRDRSAGVTGREAQTEASETEREVSGEPLDLSGGMIRGEASDAQDGCVAEAAGPLGVDAAGHLNEKSSTDVEGRSAEPGESCVRSECGCGSWSLPTRQGRDTHTTVVLTLDALAELSEDPARLAGHGTITAGYARALAEAARSVNLTVVDDHGRILGIGGRVYRPRQQLRDELTTAYPTCLFTGCHRPVDRSEFDHREDFDKDDPTRGGATDRTNLMPLCKLHHRLKTLGGWSYRPAETRSSTRTSVEGGSTRLLPEYLPAAFVFRSPLGLESVSRVDHVVRPRREVPAPF